MLARLCLVSGLFFTSHLIACKGSDSPKGAAASSAAQVQETTQIEESEDALLSKRDALFNMRRELQDKRVALVAERAEIQQSGGDTSSVDDKARAIRDMLSIDDFEAFLEASGVERDFTAAAAGGEG